MYKQLSNYNFQRMISRCGEDSLEARIIVAEKTKGLAVKKKRIFCEFNDLIVPQAPIFAEPEDNEGIKGKTWIR